MKKLGPVVVALVMTAASAHAAPFDGSAAMSCRIQVVMMCGDAQGCVRGTAESALLPPVLKVDVPARQLRGDKAGRIVKIVSVGRGPARLVLHGEEVETSGTAWNIVIDEKSGEFRAAVLPHVGGYLAFGSCAPS
jgi:hypothetical protein